MNEEKETLAQRNQAKRLEIEAERLRIGYFRSHLLPTITWGIMACIVLFAFRRLVIDGTLFGNSEFGGNGSQARTAFDNGDLRTAERKISMVLTDTPNLPSANELMAQIELVKGNRSAAIGYLRTAADTALNRETILKWIEDLEKANTTKPTTK